MAPRFWRAHHGIGTALLRSILFLGLLHHLNCLAFIVACAPVLLLTAFLLGVVLMHSDMPPLEDVDRHLYKKIRRHNDRGIIISPSDESSSSDQEEEDMTDLVVAEQEQEHEEEEEEEEAVVAWTADDERSIRSIGSLELERDARLEKLMSRRSSSLQRNLIDLDVHIPVRNLNLDMKGDPGSAPSSLMMLRQHNNPFFHDDDHVQSTKELLTRHESLTAAPLNCPSRFRPYFVANHALTAGEGACIVVDNSNSNSKKSSSSPSSSSSSATSHHQKQQQYLQAKVQEGSPPRNNNWDGNRIGMAVDVELISDSSDDDMSLPGAVSMTQEHSSDDDEKNSFEVASITQQVAAAGALLIPPLPPPKEQVAAAGTLLVPPLPPPKESQLRQQHEEAQPKPHMAAGPAGHQPQHEQEDGVAPMEERQEVSEIPVSSSSSPDAGATGAAARPEAKTRAGPGSSSGAKSSTKFKAPSKKAVFGFFRK